MLPVGGSTASCRGVLYVFSLLQDGRRSVHPGFSPHAPRQQLILAGLPSYIEIGYILRRMGTYGRFLSTLAEEVCGQLLGLLFCNGSIEACAETVYFIRKSKMADGRFGVFRARSSAAACSRTSHPLDCDPVSLFSIGSRSREDFLRFVFFFFFFVFFLPRLLSCCLAK